MGTPARAPSSQSFRLHSSNQIASNNVKTKGLLETLADGLEFDLHDLKTDGLSKEGVAELNDAAELDGEAAKKDFEKPPGRISGRATIRAAIKQKTRALLLIAKLLAATPDR